jgi:hypothetical protein
LLSPLDLAFELARAPSGSAQHHVIVVDDAQSNPRFVSEFAALIFSSLKSATSCQLHVLFTTWGSLIDSLRSLLSDIVIVPMTRHLLLVEIAEQMTGGRISPSELSELESFCRGDLKIAHLALQFWNSHQALPNRQELTRLAYEEVCRGENLTAHAQGVLYRIAALGQFEIDVSRPYAAAVSKSGFDELLGYEMLKVNEEYVSVGHRTTAFLICSHLQAMLPAAALTPPVRLAVAYLKMGDDSLIRVTLDRLDLAGMSGRLSEQHDTALLARAWLALQVLSQYLARQAEADPTWHDNLASAVFSAESLAILAPDKAKLTADYVRRRWPVSDERTLPRPSNGPPNERVDFDQIGEAMKQEDAASEARNGVSAASEIDLDRTHLTWCVGLLLGFEGVAVARDSGRLAVLLRSTAGAQLPSGAFYPERIPWITARVILGLTAAGETIRSSQTVRAACNWLRTSVPDGPVNLGVWESGTGRWNTALMTTAMCLQALLKAGIPTDDPTVQLAASYVEDNRSLWSAPGLEIDAALAIETLLLVGKRWSELADDIVRLLNWARQLEAWQTVHQTAAESHAESSKVPFVASGLVGIVWQTVKLELPLLLQGLSYAEQVGWQARRSDHLVERIRELVATIRAEIQVRQKPMAHLQMPEHGKLASALEELMTDEAQLEDILREMQEASASSQRHQSRPEIVNIANELGTKYLRAGWRRLPP